MRVPLDECVDCRLADALIGHDVRTVPQQGWAGIKNGELLALAQHEFDVFLTLDRKPPQQHDIGRFDLAVIVVCSRSNRLLDLNLHTDRIMELIPSCKAGQVVTIGG